MGGGGGYIIKLLFNNINNIIIITKNTKTAISVTAYVEHFKAVLDDFPFRLGCCL